MKTKVAMLISIAGVLVAGSAAALVNTQVLGGSTPESPLVVDNAIDAQPTNPTVTIATVAGTTPTLTVEAVPATVPATVAQAAAVVTTQASYAIGDAGTVTLDTAGDVLTIVGVTPAPGWIVSKSEAQDATNVEIKLQAGTVEIDFHANLQFGVVTTSTESKDASATASSVDDHGGGDNSGHGGGGGGDDD
jgi:hypothetical protein